MSAREFPLQDMSSFAPFQFTISQILAQARCWCLGLRALLAPSPAFWAPSGHQCLFTGSDRSKQYGFLPVCLPQISPLHLSSGRVWISRNPTGEKENSFTIHDKVFTF